MNKMEQITELLQKYSDLKIRNESELFEDTKGNLYITSNQGKLLLKVVAENGQLQVTEQKDKVEGGFRRLRSIRMVRGGD